MVENKGAFQRMFLMVFALMPGLDFCNYTKQRTPPRQVVSSC
jgi:hypothetical protein